MNFSRHEKDGIIYYTSPLFDKYNIPHLFASRFGGVSKGDFFSLNVSSSRKDSEGKPDNIACVRKNFSRGLALLGTDEMHGTMMKQIHSSNIMRADVSAYEAFSDDVGFQECDGIYCMKNDGISAMCAKSADCVPILLYDIKNDTACAVHAGWRGAVSDVCGNAVRALKELCEDVEILAAIGPCIHDCCYEVNDTVYDKAFLCAEDFGVKAEDIQACFTRKYMLDGENKYRISLPALNALYLENAGVKKENISICDMCTCCYKENGENMFFSHRASGGHSGTQMSIVAVRKQENE